VFVVVGSLMVVPQEAERFLEAAEDNAASSVRDEPGCLRFEVLGDREDANHFVFVEVYADEPAFEAHLRTTHYDRWRSARPGLLAEDPQRTICELRISGIVQASL